jgi:hypothetical protein
MQMRAMQIRYLTICLLLSLLGAAGYCDIHVAPTPPSVTIFCYMNGDNDLSNEVLHALDMMEVAGSSDRVNVVALVDGNPNWLGPYDAVWSRTRLLRLQADPHIGHITSPVLEEWGEADMGAPQTLERFLRTAMAAYPAEYFYFYMFAHGQGVLDTRDFGPTQSIKTVSISRDDTSGEKMALDDFHQALKRGLGGRRFELMVFFSCLANMVEVDYAMSDVTRYLVGSQDEIRLVNEPPGQHQIRGLRFEELIAGLKQTPAADIRELGRALVDSHVDGYDQDVRLPTGDGGGQTCRFSGGMALVNAAEMPQLVSALDLLARQLIRHAEEDDVVQAMGAALSATQPFASFLKLEYYDLAGFVRHLRAAVSQPELETACDSVLDLLTNRVIVYARHTSDCAATGISIYLSHPLVPDNIFQTHQRLYQANRFSRETQWDEMITIFRKRSTGPLYVNRIHPAVKPKGRAFSTSTRP